MKVVKLTESNDVNQKYDEYLEQHISNVKKAYEWIKENIRDVLEPDNYVHEEAYYGELDDIINDHDKSKYNKTPSVEDYYELKCEYDAYAQYFYGESKSSSVKEAFDRAWLSHIHENPHHWQHWVLVNDDDGTYALDMPYVFIIEMICDWASFAFLKSDLTELFSWYDAHKDRMILSDSTRKTVESILNRIHSLVVE